MKPQRSSGSNPFSERGIDKCSPGCPSRRSLPKLQQTGPRCADVIRYLEDIDVVGVGYCARGLKGQAFVVQFVLVGRSSDRLVSSAQAQVPQKGG